jgi:hypothetical protein
LLSSVKGALSGDDGMDHFAQLLVENTAITKLDLGSNGITMLNEALAVGYRFHVATPYLCCDSVLPVDSNQKINTTLTCLNVGSNKLGDGGARKLYDMLLQNSYLTGTTTFQLSTIENVILVMLRAASGS